MASQTTVSPQQLRGVAIMVIVVGTFAALWGLGGALQLEGVWRWITGLVVAGITLACYATAASLRKTAQRQPQGDGPGGAGPMAHPSFRLAVIFESVAIPVMAILLGRAGYGDLIISVIAIIVGLHFFMLIPAFQSRFYGWVGGAMILLALISMLLPAFTTTTGGATVGVRQVVVGFGCAVILWTSILIVVRATRRLLSPASR